MPEMKYSKKRAKPGTGVKTKYTPQKKRKTKKNTPSIAEKRGLFTLRKISKKRQKEISRNPIKALKLLGTDPGLFAQEFNRGTPLGSFLFGTPKSQMFKTKRKK